MACQAGSFSSEDEQECFKKETSRKPRVLTPSRPSSENMNNHNESPSKHSDIFSTINSETLRKFQIQRTVGLIQSRWTNLANQTLAICFGTAFAIAQDFIVTCAHNIYSQFTHMVCDEIRFVPGKKKSNDFMKEEAFPSTYEYIAYEKLGFFERYSLKPLAKDIAVVRLKKKLPFSNYIALTSRELIQGQNIEMIGYPRTKKNSGFERVDLQGEVIETRAHIIMHNMNSQNGHSGSPILCRTRVNHEWRYEVCGIHSHKGPLDYNRGIAITPQIKLKIQEMISSLRAKQPKSL